MMTGPAGDEINSPPLAASIIEDRHDAPVLEVEPFIFK
jgi:hypothetical protein